MTGFVSCMVWPDTTCTEIVPRSSSTSGTPAEPLMNGAANAQVADAAWDKISHL